MYVCIRKQSRTPSCKRPALASCTFAAFVPKWMPVFLWFLSFIPSNGSDTGLGAVWR